MIITVISGLLMLAVGLIVLRFIHKPNRAMRKVAAFIMVPAAAFPLHTPV